jgi:hypothetical protein
MALRKLQKTEWPSYFARSSRYLLGKRAEIEILSIEFGVQPSVRNMPVFGIAYDPHEDIIDIALDGMDHFVRGPRELYVDDDGIGFASLAIVDSYGVRQIVLLSEPLMLPAAR